MKISQLYIAIKRTSGNTMVILHSLVILWSVLAVGVVHGGCIVDVLTSRSTAPLFLQWECDGFVGRMTSECITNWGLVVVGKIISERRQSKAYWYNNSIVGTT